MEDLTFGKFIEQKRKERNITLRGLAASIDIAPAFMSDIEKGHRYPPKMETLEKIAVALCLDDDERNIMFDFAGKAKDNSVSPDLPEYIMNNEVVRVALCTARDTDAGEEKWRQIIKMLEEQEEN